MSKKGIDVSSHQGDINWEVVKPNIDFAILRCGYAGDTTEYDDGKFIQNANECTRLGIPFGVYLYSYATDTDIAQSEAEHTLRLVRNYSLSYPIFYDVEDDNYQGGLPKSTLTEICKTYCSLIEQAGYYVGIYSSLSWLTTKLNASELDGYDKWVAQWNEVDEYQSNHGMWQYTSDGSVPGIAGRVDMNIAYYDYPTVIKEKGLNGFQKPNEVIPPVTDSCTEQLAQAQEQIISLQKELDEMKQSKTSGTLIFTCLKNDNYYINLETGDQLYLTHIDKA